MIELTSASVVTSTTLVHCGRNTASPASVTTDNVSRVMMPPEGRVNGVHHTLVEDNVAVGDFTAFESARSIRTKKRSVSQPNGRLASSMAKINAINHNRIFATAMTQLGSGRSCASTAEQLRKPGDVDKEASTKLVATRKLSREFSRNQIIPRFATLKLFAASVEKTMLSHYCLSRVGRPRPFPTLAAKSDSARELEWHSPQDKNHC